MQHSLEKQVSSDSMAQNEVKPRLDGSTSVQINNSNGIPRRLPWG
jgi:hypothetical protein